MAEKKYEQISLFDSAEKPETPKPDPVREKITKQGFAPQKIDLKNLNSPIEKRNHETWLKDKSTMQDYTNKARTNYKNEWFKNNPGHNGTMVGGDLLGEGLNHKDAKKALAARDYMFNSLKSQLGEGYDDNDIREYTHQYFNLSPEKVTELENSVKPEQEEEITYNPRDDDPDGVVTTHNLVRFIEKFLLDRGLSPEFAKNTANNVYKNSNQARWYKQRFKEWSENRKK